MFYVNNYKQQSGRAYTTVLLNDDHMTVGNLWNTLSIVVIPLQNLRECIAFQTVILNNELTIKITIEIMHAYCNNKIVLNK